MLSIFNKSKQLHNPVKPLYNININALDGQAINLHDYSDKYILFVNVASECGFTGQYEGLEKLYKTYKEKLMIIGVPCNQFGGQEPGTEKDIATFCKRNYDVSFLMTEKVDVKGANQHPLYQWLTQMELNGFLDSSVKWNFQKYLVNNEGQLVDVFYSITKPMSSKITNLIK